MKPYEFVIGLGQVIPAWEEIGTYMKEGDKFRIWVPSQLAYGYTTAIPNIPPGSALIYELKVLENKSLKEIINPDQQ
jgi:FKBP-type peptidyl-prolyl cis-trans isomerase